QVGVPCWPRPRDKTSTLPRLRGNRVPPLDERGARAQCAPTPVSERTSSSAYFSGSRSRDRTVPSHPQRKPTGIEMMGGLLSGNHCQLLCGNIEVSAPETTGEKKTSTTAVTSPPTMAATAPAVLNRFQNNDSRIAGTLADAATAKASATRNATLRLTAS